MSARQALPDIDEFATARLTLSRVNGLDATTVRLLHGDPSAMATLGGVRTAARTQTEVEGLSAHWAQHGYGPWLAREPSSLRFVGIGGLHRVSIEDTTEVEIGYALLPEFWGLGLATELARASAYVGFSAFHFPSLVSFTLPTNLASRRVMEKIGFCFERDFTYKDFPQVLYRLTETMWRHSMVIGQ